MTLGNFFHDLTTPNGNPPKMALNQVKDLSTWWQLKYFYVHPYLGKIPILTNIFQRGWNHQLVMIDCPEWLVKETPPSHKSYNY